MTKVSEKEKRRIAKLLFDPNRPLSLIQDQQFPGVATRRRRTELKETSAMEQVFNYLVAFARAAGIQ